MKLQKLKENLIRRGFLATIYKNKESLLKDIKTLVANRTVGFGNSMTLKDLGVTEIADKNAKETFYHSPGGHGDSERSALTADIFFTSANAISLAGEIVNIDGTGNRVAATCFGPQKTVYIIGKNKIADNLESAMDRAKATAVKIAQKNKKNTPCVKTGKCEDCLSPECICSITTIHRKKPSGSDISVFLIDEEYGM